MSLFSKLFGGNKGETGRGAGRAQEFITTLTNDLNLSADQVTKVEAAIREFMGEKKQNKQSGGGKDAMRESKQDFKQDILNVLDATQQQKFMANIQNYKHLLKS
ncbi:MAG: hypothetical protein KBF42_05980 [Chitinophagales bacterium]|nr:hypothetical protein [Bacteroidota bacterium]MBP9220911.1 hypothetical protein [Chitinophagales bacterium]